VFRNSSSKVLTASNLAGCLRFRLEQAPPPAAGMEWRLDAAFNAAEEVFRDPCLKDVFKAAIANGCSIIQ
jgi:hypothetical protein